MKEMKSEIKSVLIIEDSKLTAKIIGDYLVANDYSVCGVASNYDAAKRVFIESKPDIVICDIHLQGQKSGIDFATDIKEKFPFTGIIFISSDSHENVLQRAGVTKPETYLTKPFTEVQLITAIKMLEAKQSINAPTVYGINSKEIEVLEYLGRGLTNQQIAEKLFISPHTVDSRRRKILQKLEVNSINEALCIAVSKSWIKLFSNK